MSDVHLVLNLPNGIVTATSLGLAGLAWHRSPGTSGKYHGHSVVVDLALRDGYPAFEFMNEGGWRDANADTRAALDAVRTGKRTKTALSNAAFNCTPLAAYQHVYLAKTSGALLELLPGERIAQFQGRASAEHLSPDQVASVAGLPAEETRRTRFYLVISPVEMLVLSNLTPAEYVWYATHRTGKIFRQMLFAELSHHTRDLAAREIFETALRELAESPMKKTKTIKQGECFARVPYTGWKGYRDDVEGGLYCGDCDGAYLWRFPKEIPHAWERAN
jgi:hypothetical protein